MIYALLAIPALILGANNLKTILSINADKTVKRKGFATFWIAFGTVFLCYDPDKKGLLMGSGSTGMLWYVGRARFCSNTCRGNH